MTRTHRFTLLTALISFTLLCASAFAAAPTVFPYLVSIDLDGTLFDTIKDLRQVESKDNLIRLQDGFHQPAFGATAFVQSLLDRSFKNPKQKLLLSFFSGGDKIRNQRLLDSLIMADGQSVLKHAHSVLSRNQLTRVVPVELSEGVSKSQVYRKDLTKSDAAIPMTNKVHVDDVPGYVVPGQEKNLLVIAPSYSHVDNFSKALEDQRKGMVLDWPPPSRRHWAWSTQRLIYARGALEAAFEHIESNPDVSLRDAIALVQKTRDPRELFDLGQRILAPYELSHGTRAVRLSCPRALAQLLK